MTIRQKKQELLLLNKTKSTFAIVWVYSYIDLCSLCTILNKKRISMWRFWMKK